MSSGAIKESVYLLDSSETAKRPKPNRKVLIAAITGTLMIGAFVIWRSNQISAVAASNAAALAASKAPDYVSAWQTCYPGGLACEWGYNCCVGPADIVPGAPFSSNKYTCRDFQSCASPTSNQVVKGWETCYAGSQCESGFVCCLGVGDLATNKLTCRLDGRPPNDYGGCSSGTPQSSSPSSGLVKQWETCYDGSACENGFVCCVAPADTFSGKKTCRQPGLAVNDPSGCAGSAPAPAAAPASPGNTNMPSGFQGVNVGIGSYFNANQGSDSTNGNSWCGYPYKDYSNGFAPDLSVMTDGTNAVWTGGDNNYASSAAKYCGLEARVTNPVNGVTKIMYIIDAFDPKWVRTPGSIDIMAGVWQELAGRPANDKNVVIQGITWELTGNRSPQYSFGGPGDP